MEQQEADRQQAAELQLAEAAQEVLASAMAVKAQSPTPVRVQALALVLGSKDGKDLIATVQILDNSAYIPSLKYAVGRLAAHAFVFVYDGFIINETERRDALLMVSGTRWGAFVATATPYQQAGLGAVFEPPIEAPAAADLYRKVFA